MTPTVRIHTHISGEQGLFANAYLIETERGVVAVDATLTVSESKAFLARYAALNKPLLAVLLTHAHPDHVAGVAELVRSDDVPIIATAPVERMMRQIEEPKRAQWGPVYGDEWIGAWKYPTRLLADGASVSLDGVSYRVRDLGAGGDCAAVSLWVMEAEPRAAFVGDLVFHGTHAYLADGDVLAWLANLERARSILADVPLLYPGHGPSGPLELLDRQRAYLLAYCAALKDISGGQATLTDETRQSLTDRMEHYAPDAGLPFLVALSADAVARELASAR